MPITLKQERAAREFYKTKSWEKAARAAGYKSSSAASELRCNPRIKEYVKMLEENDSLIDYASLSHCTDFLVRAVFGQISDVKVGEARIPVKFGSRMKRQILYDENGNQKSVKITFEHDPLRAMELLLRVKGWDGVEDDTENKEYVAERLAHIAKVADKIRARRIETSRTDI